MAKITNNKRKRTQAVADAVTETQTPPDEQKAVKQTTPDAKPLQTPPTRAEPTEPTEQPAVPDVIEVCISNKIAIELHNGTLLTLPDGTTYHDGLIALQAMQNFLIEQQKKVEKIRTKPDQT